MNYYCYDYLCCCSLYLLCRYFVLLVIIQLFKYKFYPRDRGHVWSVGDELPEWARSDSTLNDNSVLANASPGPLLTMASGV